jgi:transcriptional regulator with XRE-family HTH domain
MTVPAPLIRNVSHENPKNNLVITPIDLGLRIRNLRKQKGWSLDQASANAGISRSSLFKIEKGKMSPTFDALLKIAKGLSTDIGHLFVSPNKTVAAGRRSITRANEGSFYETENYQETPLTTDFANKSFIPFKLVTLARSLEDFTDWDRHESEDFMYVLSGSTVLYTEFYEPLTLEEGDSIYYDGRMGHAYISTSKEDAVMLWVSSG